MKSERTAKEVGEFMQTEFLRYGGSRFRDSQEVVGQKLAAFLGVELAPERPAAEKRPEWWGRPIPGHADPYYSTVDTLALVDAYEAARKAGVLPGLEAQSQELGNPWLNQVAVTEAAAYREYQAGRNQAMADLTFGAGDIDWKEGLKGALEEDAAPERPALPGWVEAELSVGSGGAVARLVDGLVIAHLATHHPEDYGLTISVNTLAALVEVHRRWLAAKRELEQGEGLYLPNGHSANALRILRGQDRA